MFFSQKKSNEQLICTLLHLRFVLFLQNNKKAARKMVIKLRSFWKCIEFILEFCLQILHYLPGLDKTNSVL
jgi:hypothetical protein